MSPFSHVINTYYCSTKINLYSVYHTHISHSSKIYFCHTSFLLNTFLPSISGRPFVVQYVIVCRGIYFPPLQIIPPCWVPPF